MLSEQWSTRAIFAKYFAFSRVDNFYVSLVNILIPNSIKQSVRYLNSLMYTISFIFLNISIPSLWPTPARTCCTAMVLRSPLANTLENPSLLSYEDVLIGTQPSLSSWERIYTWKISFLRPCMSENAFSPFYLRTEYRILGRK